MTPLSRPYIDTLTIRSCTGPCEPTTVEFEQYPHISPSAAHGTVSAPVKSGIPQPRRGQHSPSVQKTAVAAASSYQTISSSPAG